MATKVLKDRTRNELSLIASKPLLPLCTETDNVETMNDATAGKMPGAFQMNEMNTNSLASPRHSVSFYFGTAKERNGSLLFPTIEPSPIVFSKGKVPKPSSPATANATTGDKLLVLAETASSKAAKTLPSSLKVPPETLKTPDTSKVVSVETGTGSFNTAPNDPRDNNADEAGSTNVESSKEAAQEEGFPESTSSKQIVKLKSRRGRPKGSKNSTTKRAAKALPTAASSKGPMTSSTKSAPGGSGTKALPKSAAKRATKAKASVSEEKRARAKWNNVEDRMLIRILEKKIGGTIATSTSANLDVNWGEVATELNLGRTSKQCRDRWMNYLRPGLKKGNWEASEEEMIKSLYETFGAKWCAMSKMMPNRAENDIKNKWYSMKRKEEKRQEKMNTDLNAWNTTTTSSASEDMEVDSPADPSNAGSVAGNGVASAQSARGKEFSRLLASKTSSV